MATISVQLPENELRVARCDMLDKLIAVGDGDAALLYIYILRHGDGADGTAIARRLHMPKDRYDRAVFTLHNLTAPVTEAAQAEKAADKPQYTADELRRARLDDHRFAAVCQSAEETLGRTLTEGQLRCLLTAYDFLGLSAEAIIELLAYLKKERGAVRLVDIRRETYLWADMGIVSAQDAQRYLARKANEKPLSEALCKALGADPSQPAPKEQRVCTFALSHGFPPEAVRLAVQRTERQQGHRSLDYTLGILKRWDASGVHTVSEITALEPETRAASGQATAPGNTAASGQAIAPGNTTAPDLPVPTDPSMLSVWEQDWLERSREIERKRKEAE